MSMIVTNQRRAYLAQAQDASRLLAARLRNVPPAERAAILASTAADANCPIDVTLTTPHRSDALDAAIILDGDLMPSRDATWAWHIHSGCEFIVNVTQEDHA